MWLCGAGFRTFKGARVVEESSSEVTLARWASHVVLLCSLALAVATVPDGDHTAVKRTVGAITAFAVVAIFAAIRERVCSLRPVSLTWGCVAGVAALIGLGIDQQWASLGVAAAAIALASGQPRRALLANAGLAAVAAALLLTSSAHVTTDVAVFLIAFLIAVVLYVLARLAVLNQQLRIAHEEVARNSVDQERVRIARDLHDILGRTLVAASLRNQTAIQLVGTDPGKALVQMQAAHETLSAGQSQLRSLTSGPVVAGLAQEVESAAALCRKMGITVVTDVAEVADGENSSLCARIVREATTNMLKHSRPTRCVITIREEAAGLVVSIANNGASASSASASGTGLRDLRQRVELRGGTLEAGLVGKGHFSVIVRLPPGDDEA